jgi:hypothetical protein
MSDVFKRKNYDVMLANGAFLTFKYQVYEHKAEGSRFLIAGFTDRSLAEKFIADNSEDLTEGFYELTKNHYEKDKLVNDIDEDEPISSPIKGELIYREKGC